MQRSNLTQKKIITNYNTLVDAFKKIDIQLTKHGEEGVCAGLSLNFLLFAHENRRHEFYRYLELTAALTPETIDTIVQQTLLSPKKDFKKGGYLKFQASFDEDIVLISMERYLHFLRVISDAQENQNLNIIGCNWDTTDLIFCKRYDLAKKLEESLDHEGLYYISKGTHAFDIVKRKEGFELFEPNSMSREILKSYEDLANAILENQTTSVNNENIGFNVLSISYGDNNREIDDLIKELEKIINDDKYKSIIENDDFFASAKRLIAEYSSRQLSRMEVRLVLSEYLSQKINEEELSSLAFNLPLDQVEEVIKLELFNRLCEFKSKLDEHLEQHKDQINKFYSNQKSLENFKNQQAYTKNVSCVYLATSKNQITTLKYLLGIGADPNVALSDGRTPLFTALRGRYSQCFNILLAHPQIDPNPVLKAYECITPLMFAAQIGNLEFLKALLTHPKINASQKSVFGSMALSFAAQKGHLACVNALLPYNDPALANNDNKLPLDYAAENGHVECVKALLPYVDPEQAPIIYAKALVLAAENGHIECVKTLIPHCGLTFADANGRTALDYTAQNGHVECIKVLLEHIDPDQLKDKGIIALCETCQHGKLDCAKVLLAHNVDPNLKIQASVEILLNEANKKDGIDKKGRKSALESLLKLTTPFDSFKHSFWGTQTPLKMKVLDGFNALHSAVFFGHADVVKLLLGNGADLNSKAQGFTALDFAKAMKNYKIVGILEAAAIDNVKINHVIEFLVKNVKFFAAPFDEEHKQRWMNEEITKNDTYSIECYSQIMRALDENQQTTFLKNKDEYKKIICDLKNDTHHTQMIFKFLKKNPALTEVLLNVMHRPLNDEIILSSRQM